MSKERIKAKLVKLRRRANEAKLRWKLLGETNASSDPVEAAEAQVKVDIAWGEMIAAEGDYARALADVYQAF